MLGVLLAARDGWEGLALKMCKATVYHLFVGIHIPFCAIGSLFPDVVVSVASDFIEDRK